MTGGLPHGCAICPARFATDGERLAHHRAEHPDPAHDEWLRATATEPFRCEPCERIFSGRRALLTHRNSTHGEHNQVVEGYRPWRCGGCRRTFRTISHLQAHLRTGKCGVEPLSEPSNDSPPVVERRSDNQRYQCPDCPRNFLSVSGLLAHRRSKTHDPRGRLGLQISTSLRGFATRHGWVCFWCGEPVRDDVDTLHPLGPTREHLVPASHGGSRCVENLRLAHKRCNARRGTFTPEEYRATLTRRTDP